MPIVKGFVRTSAIDVGEMVRSWCERESLDGVLGFPDDDGSCSGEEPVLVVPGLDRYEAARKHDVSRPAAKRPARLLILVTDSWTALGFSGFGKLDAEPSDDPLDYVPAQFGQKDMDALLWSVLVDEPAKDADAQWPKAQPYPDPSDVLFWKAGGSITETLLRLVDAADASAKRKTKEWFIAWALEGGSYGELNDLATWPDIDLEKASKALEWLFTKPGVAARNACEEMHRQVLAVGYDKVDFAALGKRFDTAPFDLRYMAHNATPDGIQQKAGKYALTRRRAQPKQGTDKEEPMTKKADELKAKFAAKRRSRAKQDQGSSKTSAKTTTRRRTQSSSGKAKTQQARGRGKTTAKTAAKTTAKKTTAKAKAKASSSSGSPKGYISFSTSPDARDAVSSLAEADGTTMTGFARQLVAAGADALLADTSANSKRGRLLKKLVREMAPAE